MIRFLFDYEFENGQDGYREGDGYGCDDIAEDGGDDGDIDDGCDCDGCDCEAGETQIKVLQP